MNYGNIAQNIANTGSTQWTIPEDLQCIGAAYVLLEDSAGGVGSSMFFTIFRPIFADGFESGNLNGWSMWTSN